MPRPALLDYGVLDEELRLAGHPHDKGASQAVSKGTHVRRLVQGTLDLKSKPAAREGAWEDWRSGGHALIVIEADEQKLHSEA